MDWIELDGPYIFLYSDLKHPRMRVNSPFPSIEKTSACFDDSTKSRYRKGTQIPELETFL